MVKLESVSFWKPLLKRDGAVIASIDFAFRKTLASTTRKPDRECYWLVSRCWGIEWKAFGVPRGFAFDLFVNFITVKTLAYGIMFLHDQKRTGDNELCYSIRCTRWKSLVFFDGKHLHSVLYKINRLYFCLYLLWHQWLLSYPMGFSGYPPAKMLCHETTFLLIRYFLPFPKKTFNNWESSWFGNKRISYVNHQKFYFSQLDLSATLPINGHKTFLRERYFNNNLQIKCEITEIRRWRFLNKTWSQQKWRCIAIEAPCSFSIRSMHQIKTIPQ